MRWLAKGVECPTKRRLEIGKRRKRRDVIGASADVAVVKKQDDAIKQSLCNMVVSKREQNGEASHGD